MKKSWFYIPSLQEIFKSVKSSCIFEPMGATMMLIHDWSWGRPIVDKWPWPEVNTWLQGEGKGGTRIEDRDPVIEPK